MKKREGFKKFIEEFILLISTILILVPIYYFVIGAFKPRKMILQKPMLLTKEMFTTANFPKAIKAIKYWPALKNTAIITVVALVMLIIVSSLAGFAIARVKSKFFETYYSLLVTCMVVPFVACVIPLVVEIKNLGMHGTLLGPIMIQAAWNIPFATFLFTGFMKGIPGDLEDAAYIDGCSTFGVYWRIFLPLLAPVIASCCIVSGTGIWNDYLVCNTNLSITKTPTLMVGIYQFFGEKVNEYGNAFAGALLTSAPMVVLFLCLQKYFIKGITAGSVKG